MTVRSTSTALDAGERGDRVGDPAGDLGPQRAAGDGEGDGHADPVALDRDAPDHVEIDDRLVELGVLDGPQGVERPRPRWASGLSRLPGDFHYGVGRIPACRRAHADLSSGRVRRRRRRRHQRLR